PAISHQMWIAVRENHDVAGADFHSPIISFDVRVAVPFRQQMKNDYVSRVGRKIGSYFARARRANAPRSGKLRIEEQCSIKLHGPQDFGQDIHSVSKPLLARLGKPRRTLKQVKHTGVRPCQETDTPG